MNSSYSINLKFPIQVLEELPLASIRSLQLISCGIKKITDTTFAKLADNLEHLTITENMLTTATVLSSLPKLISLNLNYNQVDYSSKIFTAIWLEISKLKKKKVSVNRFTR